jgi:hypothetical protein
MNNTQIATEFQNEMTAFYGKKINCEFKNGRFIFSAPSKKALLTATFDFSLAIAKTSKKLSYENARVENKKFKIDAILN